MRADDICSTCGAPIRSARRQVDGRIVHIDNQADVDGDIGVVAWEPYKAGWQRPVVSIVTTSARTETPMRYRIHECEMPS